MSWVWLGAAITAEIGATLSLRASEGMRRRIWLIPVVSGYAAAFYFLAAVIIFANFLVFFVPTGEAPRTAAAGAR